MDRNFLRANQRGIAEAITFLILTSALLGITGYVLAERGRQARTRAAGLIDVMRMAEKRQNQLVDYSYSYANDARGELCVYLSNYGTESAVVDTVWVDGDPADPSDLSFVDAVTKEPTDGALPPRKLVKVTVSNLGSYTGKDEYAFAFLTESNAIYKWMVG